MFASSSSKELGKYDGATMKEHERLDFEESSMPAPLSVTDMEEEEEEGEEMKEEEEEPVLDEQTKKTIADATHMLRNLDFGFGVSPKKQPAVFSDDEYAESEEECNYNVEEEHVLELPQHQQARIVDRDMILAELEMFNVGDDIE